MIQQKNYDEFTKLMAKVADLSFAGSVLSWDQETYMPKKGGEFRARQIATLQTMAHELFVSDQTGKLIEAALGEELTEDQRVNLMLVHRDYQKKKRYPVVFVEEMANATARGFNFWHEARTKNDFNVFAPLLEKIIDLKIQEAKIIGFESHPYDALMDDYEPGLTIAKMDEVFDDVKKDLFPFMKQVIAKQKPRADFIYRTFEKDKQWEFSEKIIRKMGYDFDGGRGDFAPHPFCTTFGPGDVRITIRASENHYNEMFFAATHEAGHALYEQGLPMKEHYGLPMGSALSMAFHESQSRFWENNITRSKPFWIGHFPDLQKEFPKSLGDVTAEEFYRGVNLVEPSLIRVEADELTYHAHIFIRYQIEKLLIEGSIKVREVPKVWNDLYEEILGIRPSSDAEGCLQDVHWSFGGIGYFPTYSLGSFYAAQLKAAMIRSIPDLDQQVENGNLEPALKWLRENVHGHGRKYNSEEILTRVSGSGLKFSYFMDYVRSKYGEIYGI
jgi:carboxypeptidase Taq